MTNNSSDGLKENFYHFIVVAVGLLLLVLFASLDVADFDVKPIYGNF